jgi:hypothetical protein
MRLILPLAYVLLACAAGCGSRLNAGNVRSFQLGQTTDQDLRARFGKPDMTDERRDATGVSRLMKWEGTPGTPTLGTLRDLRVLYAETYNGRLRGWIFASSAPGAGRTRFRESNIPKVVKGQTTRDEAVRLLGEPVGRALRGCLIPDYQAEFGPGVEEIWAWFAIRGGSNLTVREFQVKFDGSGRALDVVNRSISR